MTKNNKNFKFCLKKQINQQQEEFIFFNDKKQMPGLSSFDKLITDVSYSIEDNLLFVYGNEDIIKYSYDFTPIDDLDEPPAEEYIKYTKKIKFFGITFFDKVAYVKYYYKLKRKLKVRYFIKNFIIKEIL